MAELALELPLRHVNSHLFHWTVGDVDQFEDEFSIRAIFVFAVNVVSHRHFGGGVKIALAAAKRLHARVRPQMHHVFPVIIEDLRAIAASGRKLVTFLGLFRGRYDKVDFASVIVVQRNYVGLWVFFLDVFHQIRFVCCSEPASSAFEPLPQNIASFLGRRSITGAFLSFILRFFLFFFIDLLLRSFMLWDILLSRFIGVNHEMHAGHVPLHVLSVARSEIADVARVRPLSGMAPHVSLEGELWRVHFAAHIANVALGNFLHLAQWHAIDHNNFSGSLSFKDFIFVLECFNRQGFRSFLLAYMLLDDMAFQFFREHWSERANTTLVELVLVVHQHVFPHVVPVSENLVTLLALEGLLFFLWEWNEEEENLWILIVAS